MASNYEQLVKALRIHASVDIECYECAYHDDCCTNGNGHTKMMTDAAAAIEGLVESVHIRDKHLDELNHYIWELEAQLPKRGEWIYKPKDAIEMMFTLPKCSVCGYESPDANNYCPNCGSLMVGENDERN